MPKSGGGVEGQLLLPLYYRRLASFTAGVGYYFGQLGFLLLLSLLGEFAVRVRHSRSV